MIWLQTISGPVDRLELNILPGTREGTFKLEVRDASTGTSVQVDEMTEDHLRTLRDQAAQVLTDLALERLHDAARDREARARQALHVEGGIPAGPDKSQFIYDEKGKGVDLESASQSVP